MLQGVGCGLTRKYYTELDMFAKGKAPAYLHGGSVTKKTYYVRYKCHQLY
jgi:hypothetical protein